jgi:hypothetical protein
MGLIIGRGDDDGDDCVTAKSLLLARIVEDDCRKFGYKGSLFSMGDVSIAIQWVAERHTKRLKELESVIVVINELHNLSDAICDVREREGLGWDGPLTRAYSDAVSKLRALLKEGEEVLR